MRDSSPAAAVGVLLLVLLPILYVLSIGPAIWLHDHGFMPGPLEDIAEAVYTPLVWAASLSPALEAPLDFYIELWEE